MRGGCLYEPESQNGITHLLEHVSFRNLNYLYGSELYRLLDKKGLDFNASTYKEFVRFTVIGAPKHFDFACRVLCDLFKPITVPASDIATEKKRIKAEIREADDKNSLDYFADGFVWEGTPLKNLITGKISVVDSVGKTALESFRRELLCSENLFFYVTGNVSDAQCESLKELCEGADIGHGAGKKENIAPVPKSFFKRNCLVTVKNSCDHFLRFSFDLDTARFDCVALNLLYDVLFCGDNCKMFQELSEKNGIVYSYDARLEKYNNVGNLSFSFEVKPQDIIKAVEIVVGLLKDMKRGISDELDYVRAAYTDNGDMILDNPDELNWARAYNCHILGEFYPDERERSRVYASIKNDDIDRLSREIFTCDNLVLSIKTNKKKADTEKIRNILLKL